MGCASAKGTNCSGSGFACFKCYFLNMNFILLVSQNAYGNHCDTMVKGKDRRRPAIRISVT